MTIKQKIKKARYVFGWVRLSEDDGTYLQIQKQSILQAVKEMEDVLPKEDYEDKVRRRLADKYRKFRKLETKNPVQYKKYVDATNKEGTFILSDLYERQSRAKKSNTEKAISLFESMTPEEKEKALALLQSK